MLLVVASQVPLGEGRGDPLGEAFAQPQLGDVVLAEPGVGHLVLGVVGAAGLIELHDAGRVVGAGVAAGRARRRFTDDDRGLAGDVVAEEAVDVVERRNGLAWPRNRASSDRLAQACSSISRSAGPMIVSLTSRFSRTASMQVNASSGLRRPSQVSPDSSGIMGVPDWLKVQLGPPILTVTWWLSVVLAGDAQEDVARVHACRNAYCHVTDGGIESVGDVEAVVVGLGDLLAGLDVDVLPGGVGARDVSGTALPAGAPDADPGGPRSRSRSDPRPAPARGPGPSASRNCMVTSTLPVLGTTAYSTTEASLSSSVRAATGRVITIVATSVRTTATRARQAPDDMGRSSLAEVDVRFGAVATVP